MKKTHARLYPRLSINTQNKIQKQTCRQMPDFQLSLAKLYKSCKWYDIRLKNKNISGIIINSPPFHKSFCHIQIIERWFQMKRSNDPSLQDHRINNMIEKFYKFEKIVSSVKH